MNLNSRIEKLETKRPPEPLPFISVLIETDGICEVSTGKTFSSEKEFDEYFKDQDVNIIKRRIVDP